MPIVASLTVISKDNVEYLVDIYDRFKEVVDIFVFYFSWWIDEERADLHENDFKSRFGFSPVLHRGWVGNWRPEKYELLKEQVEELKRRSRAFSGAAVTFIPDLSSIDEIKRYYTDHRETFGFNECGFDFSGR